MTQSGFAEASAVTPLGGGAFTARTPQEWSNGRTANGGYLVAVMMRALIAEVGDPARQPLSLTFHYLSGVVDGEVTIRVVTERAGRGVTALSALLEQDGVQCVKALASFSVERTGPLEYATPAPTVPEPEGVPPLAMPQSAPPLFHRIEHRQCLGPEPFSAADESEVGGWMRLRHGEETDAAALGMFTDGWPPSAWARLTGPMYAPTLDMTIHFRNAIPAGTTWVLARMSSSTSVNGYFEEDGTFWTPDGMLLAQSRQLQLLRPPRSR